MSKNKKISLQIDYIESVLKASGKYIFNGRKLIVAGILFLFIPLFQYLLNKSFWELYIFRSNLEIGVILNILIYIAIFSFAFKLTKVNNSTNYHLSVNIYVKKAIGLHDVIIKTMLACIVMLCVSGYSTIAFPIVYIFLGFVYNLFGRFSLEVIKKISISYIILGLVSIPLLSKYNFICSLMCLYLGITYIIMGNILEKNR